MQATTNAECRDTVAKSREKTGAQVKLGIKRARKLQKQKSNDNTASKTTEKSPKSTPFKLPPIPALPPNWTAYKTKAGRQYYHKKGIRAVLFGSNVLLETLAIAMQTRSVWRNVTNFVYILYVTDFQEAKLLSGSDPAYRPRTRLGSWTCATGSRVEFKAHADYAVGCRP